MAAKEIIQELKSKVMPKGGLKAVFFVGCGGSQAALYSANYLMKTEAKNIATSLTNSNEFVHATPAALDDRCACIFCSQKATPETVKAVETANERGAFTIALTGSPETLMAKTAQHFLTYTVRSKGNQATSLKLVFEILHQFEEYPYYEEAMAAYDKIDAVVEKGLEVIMPTAKQWAVDYKDDPLFYVLGCGNLYASAYTMACCHLMEMQWKHTVMLHSGEYFHGPFETTDKNLPIVLLKGVGKTRPLDERVERFLSQYAERYVVVDTKDFGIEDLGEHVAEYFNATVMITIERELVYQMSLITEHPMETRRYMWQFEY